MKDLLYAVLGLISAALTVFFMYWYIGQKAAEASSIWFIIAIVFAVLALLFGALFMSGRVNKTEEIHITE